MPVIGGPVLVGMFGRLAQAEGAAEELRADAGVVRSGAEWSDCLGRARDVAELLAGLGVGAEEAAYYRAEVAAGRFLLVAGVAGGAAPVLAAIGKNCGSVRIPPDGA